MRGRVYVLLVRVVRALPGVVTSTCASTCCRIRDLQEQVLYYARQWKYLWQPRCLVVKFELQHLMVVDLCCVSLLKLQMASLSVYVGRVCHNWDSLTSAEISMQKCQWYSPHI